MTMALGVMECLWHTLTHPERLGQSRSYFGLTWMPDVLRKPFQY